jgi:hypothetical protein
MRYLMLVFLPLLLIACSSSDTGPWQDRDASEDAYSISQEFLNQRLINSETAKYPSNGWSDKVQIMRDGESQRYSIIAYVDSEDAFGEVIRTEFTTDVEQTSEGEWLLHDLQTNEL